jgi:chromosome segregation protein
VYLKSIEMIGFKSFADKTKLVFEPGMTAIVGPNGCGKSNVSDAIRWVLGEQSAKALRGSKMEDVIFNGTDTHKPVGMAEVSLTLTACEERLGTEFNEVTVTRRVFRSGEGAYFINKAPCRLKDIQRLFMDTGMGTDAYSIMEQGRIDLILSSRPEDRREVFEEASGITKYKSDKKEAIRKLEATEANLLRLSDIIREVRRQIISLQRQVGKAHRYKTLQEQLRGYDLFLSRERLQLLANEIQTLETKLASLAEQEEAAAVEVTALDERASVIRAEMSRTEQEISDAIESASAAKSELDRIHDLLRVNNDRIRELEQLSERDTRDAAQAELNLATHREGLAEIGRQLEQATTERAASEQALAAESAKLGALDKQLEKLRAHLNELRAESMTVESRLTRSQNDLAELEARERTTVIRRERLSAEKAEIERTLSISAAHRAEMQATLETLAREVQEQRDLMQALSGQRAERAARTKQLRGEMGQLQSQAAAKQAQLELLRKSEAEAKGFPGGAKLLLDAKKPLSVSRDLLLGSLASLIKTGPEYGTALEVALRAWMDAVVVRDEAAGIALLHELLQRAAGSARMLAVTSPAPQPATVAEAPGVSLFDQVSCADEVRPLLQRLLGNVRVVANLGELPQALPDGVTFVTPQGALVRAGGAMECWLPESREAAPLARRNLITELTRQHDELKQRLAADEHELASLTQDDATLEATQAQARTELEERQRKLAVRQGEQQVLTHQEKQQQQRVEVVTWELESLEKQQGVGGDQRGKLTDEMERLRNRQADIRAALATQGDELRAQEQQREAQFTAVSEHRIQAAARRQHCEHLAARREPMQARIRELEALILERTGGINSYRARIQDLQTAIHAAQTQVTPLEATVQQQNARLAAAHERRAQNTAALTAEDTQLRQRRAALDEIRKQKAHFDIERTEQRMRHQTLAERVTGSYNVMLDDVLAAPEPAWENGIRPERDQLETQVAEIRAKMESMGPVNLVAIEEHQELEQRYNFLVQQQDDLTKAKEQLMELIKRINKTTTEMFFKTFEQVNLNFQTMFTRMFGGGTAKLVLVDEEDVLECGIEIIARPPGTKLQSVSLLSGGQRTMTAIALLFSLYQVKPSPFCVLDELDAALDDSNIGRFIAVLKDFVLQSQFIVITHNRQTIAAAGVLYGVTMEQRGISRIVSVKFSHEKRGGSGKLGSLSGEAATHPEEPTLVAPPESAPAPEPTPPPAAEATPEPPPPPTESAAT